MLKPCRSLKTRNECIVTDNSKLPVTDLLRMLLNRKMRNGEGKWFMENRKYPILFFPFPIPHIGNIPSFTNRKTKKSVKCFISERYIIQNLLFYTLIHIVLTAFLLYSFPTGRVSLKKSVFFLNASQAFST